jgi:hypothetical protein
MPPSITFFVEPTHPTHTHIIPPWQCMLPASHNPRALLEEAFFIINPYPTEDIQQGNFNKYF